MGKVFLTPDIKGTTLYTMKRERYIFIACIFFSFLFLPSSDTTQLVKEEVSARIITISDDGKEITINRGKADNLIPGSEVIIRPNRGPGYAKIEWDIYFALGTIKKIDETSSVAAITDRKDTIQPGDYCAVYGKVPANLMQTDIGRIALFDIVFLDYGYEEPFFTLGELIKDPSKERMDRITGDLLEEIHFWAAEAGTWSDEKIQGGIFNGMSWGEALEQSGKEEIEEFLEFVSYFPGNYINYSWIFIDIYISWMTSGTLSGEPEKKKNQAAPYADSGDSMVLEGKYQEAIEEYKKAIDILPEYAYAKERLQLVNNMLKHMKMIELDPGDVITKYDLGTEYYDLDLYQEALTQFIEAKDLGYENRDLMKFTGYTFSALGNYSQAIVIFEQLNKELPKNKNIQKWLTYVKARESLSAKENADAYVQLGDLQYNWEDYDSAIAEYNKALKLRPDSRDIWERIVKTTKRRNAHQYQKWALEYWQEGQFKDAREYWDTALEGCREIDDLESVKQILLEIASRMYDWSFYDDAIDVYKQVLEIDPGHYDSYISLSNCYKDKKDYNLAIQWVEGGIKVDPGDAWGYNILGYIYLQEKELDKAVVQLKKAVELDRNYKYPNYNLATAYIFKGNYAEAQGYLRRALEIDKDYWDARHDLTDIECVMETTQLLDLNANNIDARLRFARALFNLHDYDTCITELLRVLKMKRKNVTALKYLGYAYTRLGDYKEGRSFLEQAKQIDSTPGITSWLLYNEAQALLQKNPDDPEAYMKLGEDDLFWEYYDDALVDFENAQEKGADPQRVFDMMEKARTGNEAKKTYKISTDYYNRAEYDKALEYAGKAFNLYKKIGAKEGTVWVLLRMGWCYANMYRHEVAREKYEEAGNIAKELGDDVLYAHYISSVGDYYKNLGDFESALEYKQQAQELYHKSNDLINEASMTLSSIGYIFGTMGEFDTMIEYYERALSIHSNMMNYSGEASALNDIGGAYADDGDYSKALEYKFKALRTAQDYNDTWTELWAYRGIGDIYFDLGDSDNAVKSFNHYSAIATALGSKSDRAIALNDLGRVYLEYTKNYDEASRLFQESYNLAEITGYTLMQGVATSNIGVVYSKKGQYNKALEYHDKGFEILKSLNDSYTQMQGLNEKGETLFEMKRYKEALECHLASIALCETLNNKAEKWKYELNAGKTCEKLNRTGEAITYYKQSIETLSGIKKKIKSDALRKGFSDQDRQIDVYKRLIDLLIKNDRADEAFSYIEESKSRIIKDSFGDVKPVADNNELKETLSNVDKIEKKREALEKQLQEEKKKPAGEQDATKIEILTNTLASTEGEFNQWMLKLKFKNRKMYDALTINPTTLGDIQDEIPANTLILEYFISSDQLYIFCIGKNYFFARSVRIAEDELVERIRDFLALCTSVRQMKKKDLDTQSVKLYNILFRPVEDQMNKFENIVVVPFGILYYLPFHALIREQGGKKEYVLETRRISYTTSATFSDVLKETGKKLKAMLALGNPDGSLPAATREVELLKSSVFKESALVWTGGEATKSNFLDHAKEYDIVHLATHGVILNNPLQSYLLFAGTNEDEQRLTLLEVAGYTSLREKTGLVFLSACKTAMESTGGNGSELISLAEAFAMAGPPTLVATLWEVNDVSTSKVVLKFYEELTGGKKDKLEALRSAQMMLIGDKNFSHPYFWAPFIMLGNWR
ncbi:MAG: tetratricopeptide repeat protein [Spirochaetales bacterium]|nr:tetratricopeptide repeat protein [Spirochaetales bacterium]